MGKRSFVPLGSSYTPNYQTGNWIRSYCNKNDCNIEPKNKPRKVTVQSLDESYKVNFSLTKTQIANEINISGYLINSLNLNISSVKVTLTRFPSQVNSFNYNFNMYTGYLYVNIKTIDASGNDYFKPGDNLKITLTGSKPNETYKILYTGNYKISY
jgi:hypothetical protein